MRTAPAVPLRRLRASLLALAFLFTTVLAAVVAPPTADAAGVKYNSYFVTDVYISVTGGRVNGYIRITQDVGSTDFYFVTATVYVTQCRADLTVCGTFAANSGGGSNIVSTSSKPAAYGHVYKTCSSFTLWDPTYPPRGRTQKWTNVCSPWSSYP
jgi:hypothetical protein